MGIFKTRTARTILFACSALAGNAALAAPAHHITLPAQNLAASLQSVGAVTGTSIVFSPAAVAGKQAPALEGNYEAREALHHLIRGNGLQLEEAPGGTFVVKQAKPVSVKVAGSRLVPAAYHTVAQPAEAPSAPPASRPAASAGLQDIVVTARRRSEELQSVPISIQAFSGDTITERNVTTALDLQKLVPALTTYSQAHDEVTISIRGMSSSGSSTQGLTPRVMTYFAQIPMQVGDTGPGHFFDLENIQVLKGPQGTLFGRNSTGGAVLYEPTKPKDTFGGYINAQLGRFHDTQIDGAINVPVTDTLAIRLAGKYARTDGYTKNLVTGKQLDGRNYWALRGSIKWDPSESFSSLLIVDYLRSDTDGSSQQIYAYDPDHVYVADLFNGALGQPVPLTLGGEGPSLAEFAANPGATIPAALAAGRVSYFPDPILSSVFHNQQVLGPRVSFSAVDAVARQRSFGITSISDLHLGDKLTVRNIFGYRRFKQMSRYDFDGMTDPILEQITPDGDWMGNTRQITEELQLQGTALDDRLDFTLGGFLLWGDPVGEQRRIMNTLGTPGLTTSIPKEKSQAVYGQITYELLDGLKATAGYRYTHDFRSLLAGDYRDKAMIFPPSSCNLDLTGCPTYTESSFNNSSYNFNLDYQLLPATMIYASHRRGYRSGGLNPQAGDFGFNYGPETVLDFEVGLKTDFTLASMPGRLNLAAFHSKLKHAQANETFSVTDPDTNTTQAINIIANPGTAKVKGIEADLMLNPAKGLNLTVSYALTDGKYTSFVNSQTGIEENRPFPFLAKNRLNINGSYELALPGSLGQLAFGANWSYSSSYFLSVFDEPFGKADGYNSLDLRIDWKNFDDRKARISFFVHNVTNQVYRVGGVPVYDALGTTSAIYNEPRTWGLQFHYAFGND